jgi:hypothetical protein
MRSWGGCWRGESAVCRRFRPARCDDSIEFVFSLIALNAQLSYILINVAKPERSTYLSCVLLAWLPEQIGPHSRRN